MGSPSPASSLSAVPLFPLPNVVLFPRAVLPLHIFEQRYRQMTVDVLAGERQIAMAILRAGWEKSYYDRPELEPVVCVGTMLSHEKLPDGKCNFLLQGTTRARIVKEVQVEKPYRVARLEQLTEIMPPSNELVEYRRLYEDFFIGRSAEALPGAPQLRRLFDTPLTAPEIADLIAFNCFDDPVLKQSLLAECDVQKRLARVLGELRSIRDRAVLTQSVAQRAQLN